MMIIGCDFHPSWQQVSWLDSATGEIGERKLVQAMARQSGFTGSCRQPALIGVEATGNCQWLLDLLAAVWATRCGWGMRRRFGPATCAGRRPTGAMPCTF